MKRFLNPFRIAAALLVLYALGHTLGALAQTPKFGMASDGVVLAMKSVSVDVDGFACSWWGFYLGFGWSVTIFFLFAAVLSWFLGGLSETDQRTWSMVTWVLFLSFVANTFLAWRFFFLVPLIFSAAITLLLGFQSVKLARGR
jgi:hypothetical protein